MLKQKKAKHRKAQMDPAQKKQQSIKEAEDCFWKAHKKAEEEGDVGNQEEE